MFNYYPEKLQDRSSKVEKRSHKMSVVDQGKKPGVKFRSPVLQLGAISTKIKQERNLDFVMLQL